MVHQPSAGFQGQATDIEIHARKYLKQSELNEIYHNHTGKEVETIENALERDRFLSGIEAGIWYDRRG